MPPQAVEAEKVLEERAELGVFVVQELLVIEQDRPLHVGMEVHFRFIDGDDEGQVALPFFVDDEIVFDRHGAADGHQVDLGDDAQGGQGNEFHVVRPGPVHAAEHAGQEEDVDEIR